MVVEKFGGLLPNNTLAENTLVDWLLPQQINKDKNCWKIRHGGLVVKHQIHHSFLPPKSVPYSMYTISYYNVYSKAD